MVGAQTNQAADSPQMNEENLDLWHSLDSRGPFLYVFPTHHQRDEVTTSQRQNDTVPAGANASSSASSTFQSLRCTSTSSSLHHNALDNLLPAHRWLDVVYQVSLSLAGSDAPAVLGERRSSPSPDAASKADSPNCQCGAPCQAMSDKRDGCAADGAWRMAKRSRPEPTCHDADSQGLEEWSVGPGRPFSSEAMRRRRR